MGQKRTKLADDIKCSIERDQNCWFFSIGDW